MPLSTPAGRVAYPCSIPTKDRPHILQVSCQFLNPLVLLPKGNDIASAAVQLIEGRDALGPEAQSRLNNTLLQVATTMLQTAQHNDALTQLGNPDPVPKKVWRKKKAHGPADAAGLTSAEIAYRDLLAKEKAKKAANRAANHAPESADEEDPGLLPPLQRPQGWRNLAARRGRVEGPLALWRYTRAL
jgi:hypothetical protein